MATGFFLSPAEQDLIVASVISQPAETFFPLTTNPPITVRLISGVGSDRKFFRIDKEEKRAILMISPPPAEEEFVLYLKVGKFLRHLGAGVPEFYQVDLERKVIFMEDLGKESLYYRVHNGMGEEELIFWYQKEH